MRVKNGELYLAREPLRKLIEQKFPVKVAWGLAKLANKLNDNLRPVDETRNGLIKKYGTQEGSQYHISPGDEAWEAFSREHEELMAQEVEMVFDKVRIPEKVAGACDKCSHNMDICLTIEPNVLMALEQFIEVV